MERRLRREKRLAPGFMLGCGGVLVLVWLGFSQTVLILKGKTRPKYLFLFNPRFSSQWPPAIEIAAFGTPGC